MIDGNMILIMPRFQSEVLLLAAILQFMISSFNPELLPRRQLPIIMNIEEAVSREIAITFG